MPLGKYSELDQDLIMVKYLLTCTPSGEDLLHLLQSLHILIVLMGSNLHTILQNWPHQSLLLPPHDFWLLYSVPQPIKTSMLFSFLITISTFAATCRELWTCIQDLPVHQCSPRSCYLLTSWRLVEIIQMHSLHLRPPPGAAENLLPLRFCGSCCGWWQDTQCECQGVGSPYASTDGVRIRAIVRWSILSTLHTGCLCAPDAWSKDSQNDPECSISTLIIFQLHPECSHHQDVCPMSSVVIWHLWGNRTKEAGEWTKGPTHW